MGDTAAAAALAASAAAGGAASQGTAQQQRAAVTSPTAPPVKRIGVLMVQLCSATMKHTTPLHPAVRIRVGKQVCFVSLMVESDNADDHLELAVQEARRK